MGTVDEAVERAASGRRIGVGVYLALWLVLFVPQLYALAQVAPLMTDEAGPQWVPSLPWFAVAFAFQALKVPVALPRLRDLGRPPDDSVWTFLPILNLVFWFALLRRAPADDKRRRRIRSWATQLGVFDAYRRGLGWMGRTVSTGLPVALAFGAVAGIGEHMLLASVFDAEGEGRVLWEQGLTTLAGFLLLFTIVQVFRRKSVSRASWWPAIFLLPTILILAAYRFEGLAASGLGPVLTTLVFAAWAIGAGAVLGGLSVASWVIPVHRLVRDASFDRSVADAATDAIVTYGWRTHLVQIGGQAVIPGIWFGISYAFSDLIAVVDSSRPVFKDSNTLTRGIRNKLFKLMALWFLSSVLLQSLSQLIFVPFEVAMAGLLDPSALPMTPMVASYVVWAMLHWAYTLAMLALFYERDDLLEAKRASDAAQEDGGGVVAEVELSA